MVAYEYDSECSTPITRGSAAELVTGAIKSAAIKSNEINQDKNFNLFFMIPPFMIKKTRKKLERKSSLNKETGTVY
jgi:hypothetical protein